MNFATPVDPLRLAVCQRVQQHRLVRQEIDYKSENAAKNRLEVPPDLTRPQLNNNYALPGASSVSAQQLNQQAQATACSKKPVQCADRHPGGAYGARLASSAGWWCRKKPEELWPLLKEFWIDNGFILKQDAPEIGVMETDWAENRAKIPQDGIRNLLSKVGLDNVY